MGQGLIKHRFTYFEHYHLCLLLLCLGRQVSLLAKDEARTNFPIYFVAGVERLAFNPGMNIL